MLGKKTKKGEIRAALGEILLDVRQLDESSMELDIYEGPEINFRPMAILHHLLEEPLGRSLGLPYLQNSGCALHGAGGRKKCPQS